MSIRVRPSRHRSGAYPTRTHGGRTRGGDRHRPEHWWSWDITERAGPAERTRYYLYVVIDIYSRYVPGGGLLVYAENAASPGRGAMAATRSVLRRGSPSGPAPAGVRPAPP